MHIDYYGLHINIQNGPGRIIRIGSAVDAFEFDMAHDFLRGGDICLVAGGGRGSVAMWIAAKLGIYNTVIFEVIPDLWRMMNDNIKFNGESLPYLYWGSLGTENKKDAIFVPKLYTGNSVPALINAEAQSAPSVDINDVLKSHKITALNLDVEGDEFKIIPHMDLTNIRVISMEMHGPYSEGEKLKSYLESNGFNTVFLVEHEGPYPAQHITLQRT